MLHCVEQMDRRHDVILCQTPTSKSKWTSRILAANDHFRSPYRNGIMRTNDNQVRAT